MNNNQSFPTFTKLFNRKLNKVMEVFYCDFYKDGNKVMCLLDRNGDRTLHDAKEFDLSEFEVYTPNTPKYVELEKALEIIHTVMQNAMTMGDWFEIQKLLTQASVKAIEVARANNIGHLVHGHCEFKCSRCGADAGEIAYGSMDGASINYCPNCAAFIGDGKKEWDGTFGGDEPIDKDLCDKYKADGWPVPDIHEDKFE